MKEPFQDFVANQLENKFVLITCGLPSTGKSIASGEIARLKNSPRLRSDIIRLDVLKNDDIFDEKVASNPAKRNAVYDEMFRLADETLKTSGSVILDATFVTQSLRARAAEIASRHNLPLIIVETRSPQEVAVRRILSRTKENYQSNALTEQAYLNNKQAFEDVDLAALKKQFPQLKLKHIIVDTTSSTLKEWFITEVIKK